MKKKNNVGRNSLIISVTGLILIEILFMIGIISGSLWKIIELGFEAATVGGLADWFAVSALFREIPIPIPFVKKHTNIIVKNRKKLTEGASDLVTSKWLSAESMKSKIKDFEFSGMILRLVNEPNSTYKKFAIDLIRDILKKFTGIIDNPDVLSFLRKILEDQIRGLELSKPLGKWIKDSFREGKQNDMWDMIIRNIKKIINNRDAKEKLSEQLEKLIFDYKQESWLKKITVNIAEFFEGLDRDLIASKIINALNEFLEEAENNPDHEFRKKLDNVIIEFADGLISNKKTSVKIIDKLKENLLSNPDLELIIRKALSDLKETITLQLENNDTILMKAIIRNIDLLLNEVSLNKTTQIKIDEWIRNTLSGLIDKYHHKIGDMVIDSMNKLKDEDLVNQIEEKVGDDLQYIRLNGALVGGLAGILIGVIKFMLSR